MASPLTASLSFLKNKFPELIVKYHDLGTVKPLVSPRKLLKTRISGAIVCFVKALLTINTTTSSCFIDDTFLESLSLLEQLSYDYDFSVEFADLGGHFFLKKLLLLQVDDDDERVSTAVEQIVCAITASGCAFPLKKGIEYESNSSASSTVLPPFWDFIETTGNKTSTTRAKQSFSDDEQDRSSSNNNHVGHDSSSSSDTDTGSRCIGTSNGNGTASSTDCCTRTAAADMEEPLPDEAEEEGDYSPLLQSQKTTTTLRVFLRSVPQGLHGAGQHAVGYILWSSGVILSRIIVSNHRHIIAGKSVLEVGAGVGLCGLVASRYASSVVITDYYNEQILRNIQLNIGLNTGEELIDGKPGIISSDCHTEVAVIDWNLLDAHGNINTNSTAINRNTRTSTAAPSSSSSSVAAAAAEEAESEVDDYNNDDRGNGIISNSDNNSYSSSTGIHTSTHTYTPPPPPPQFQLVDTHKKFDVLIGSDLVCCVSDAFGVARVVNAYLSSDGIFILVVPQPRHRYGTEQLVPALVAAGLEVFFRPIRRSTTLISDPATNHTNSNNYNTSTSLSSAVAAAAAPLSSSSMDHCNADNKELTTAGKEQERQQQEQQKQKQQIEEHQEQEEETNNKSSSYHYSFGNSANPTSLSPTQWYRGDDDSLIDLCVPEELNRHDKIMSLLGMMDVNCDELVEQLDEADYIVWNLIVGRWRKHTAA